MKTYKKKYYQLYASYSNLITKLGETAAISDARKIQLDTTGLFDPVEYQEKSKQLSICFEALEVIKELEFTDNVRRTTIYNIADEALLQTKNNPIKWLK